MQLLVGLGNPGESYARNRHNIGFQVVDAIAGRYGIGAFRNKFSGQFAAGQIDSHRVLLLKPQTYMNNSGRSVGAAMRFYKLEPTAVLVIHDEIDFVPGRVQVRTGGGVAGHNGLRSIRDHVGADFRRMRIGVGHPGHKDAVADYVLSNFSKADAAWRDPLIAQIAEALPHLLNGKDSQFAEALKHA